MKILQISYADTFAGGEKMAITLYEQYKNSGHQSYLVVGSKRGNNPDIIEIPFGKKSRIRRKIWNIIERKTAFSDIFILRQQRIQSFLKLLCLKPGAIFRFLSGEEFYDYPETRKIFDLIPFKPDIIHCHSLRGYFDLRFLPELSSKVPLVMTLHAPWPITGQCNPPFDCEEWKQACNPCKYPSHFPHFLKKTPNINLLQKKAIYTNMRIGVISPSKWLLEMATKSVLAPAMCLSRVIPNGVDTTIFSPSDSDSIRITLNLPRHTPILLITAQGVKKNQMKDFPTLYKALLILSKNKEIKTILCIALHGEPFEEIMGPVTLRILPYQKDHNQLVKYFQASDIYVHPARSDNFPTTILEAMACGKPVVASDVSGIPEMVDPGVTGLLVPPGDPQALADALKELITNRTKREKMGDQARKRAVERFSLEKMAQDHIDFYQEMIHAHNKG